HSFADPRVVLANVPWSAVSGSWVSPAARVLFGVLVPLIAFGANEVTFTRSEMVPQSHEAPLWRMLYAAEVQRWLYPLLLWAMAAIVAQAFGRRSPWIRTGLRGGVVLALAFSILYLPAVPMAAVGIMLAGLGLLGFAPYMTLAAFVSAVWSYGRERDDERENERNALALTWFWWFVAVGSSAIAWLRMNELYSQLPARESHGGCYLCTVAAQGDRRVTGAEPVHLSDGRTLLVSMQLRRFKAAEIVLAALAPRVHRAVRALYDRVGPRLAARVTPRGATALHVAFKPAEWLVALALRVLLREPEELLRRTYFFES
ncbi:MAG: DUF6688 family protein, partial [Planctomycetota bacterium]